MLFPNAMHHWHSPSASLSVPGSVVTSLLSWHTHTGFGLSANFPQSVLCKFRLDLYKKTKSFCCVTSSLSSIINMYRSDLMTDISIKFQALFKNISLNLPPPTYPPPPSPPPHNVRCTFSPNFVLFFIASRPNHCNSILPTIVWNVCVFHTTCNDWKLDMEYLTCAAEFCACILDTKSKTGINVSTSTDSKELKKKIFFKKGPSPCLDLESNSYKLLSQEKVNDWDALRPLPTIPPPLIPHDAPQLTCGKIGLLPSR